MSLRWASQELAKVATVSQIAVPHRRRGLDLFCWASQELTKVAMVSQVAAPQADQDGQEEGGGKETREQCSIQTGIPTKGWLGLIPPCRTT
eukprot:6019317-Pyramimonas_sp.AAC.1